MSITPTGGNILGLLRRDQGWNRSGLHSDRRLRRRGVSVSVVLPRRHRGVVRLLDGEASEAVRLSK